MSNDLTIFKPDGDRVLCLVSELCTGRDQHRVAGSGEAVAGAAGVENQRTVADEQNCRAVLGTPRFAIAACDCPC